MATLKSTIGYGMMDLAIEGREETTSHTAMVLGNGGMGMAVGYHPNENLVGVVFQPVTTREVGVIDNPEPCDIEEVEFELLFDNPASLDAVMTRLQQAKDKLLSTRV